MPAEKLRCVERCDRRLKLYQIEYMLASCKYGSITKAANVLMVSRPAISRALRELEEEFGMPLFKRSSGGTELTDVGVLFYEKCEKIMEMVDNLNAEMQQMKMQQQSEHSLVLRIGLSPVACSEFFPEFYSDFTQANPDIQMETQELLAANTMDMLSNNTIDVGIALGMRPNYEGMLENAKYVNIDNYQLFFVCNKDHPLAGRRFITEGDIKNERFVELDESLLWPNELFGGPNMFTFHPLNSFRTRQFSMVMQMVRTGSFCSLRFYRRMGGGFTEDDIVFIPFSEPIIAPLRLIWNGSVIHNAAFHRLLSYFSSKQIK